MKHSLFASTSIKLFSGALLFTLLQACGGGGSDGDSTFTATDAAQEQSSASVGPSASAVTDAPAEPDAAPAATPPEQQMFPTHPTGFPTKTGLQFDEYHGTWFAVDSPCRLISSQFGLTGRYSKEYSLFISDDLIERHVDIFHDRDCLEKALQMIYSVNWKINSIEMAGHSNAIRMYETTGSLRYDLDGGSGFKHDITVVKPNWRYILADVHDGKLYFTAAPTDFAIDFPRRLDPEQYYTR